MIRPVPDIAAAPAGRLAQLCMGLACLAALAAAGSVTEAAAAAGGAEGPAPSAEAARLTELLRQRLEPGGDEGRLVVGGERLLCAAALPRFYQRRTYAPAWSDGRRLSAQADSLLAALAAAAAEGLQPDGYHHPDIQQLRDALQGRRDRLARTAWLADLDLLLTDAWLLYGSHLLSGRINPETIDPEWFASRREADLADLLEQALAGRRVAAALRDLLPEQPGYVRLRMALAGYRTLAKRGGWPLVPDGPRLGRADAGARVAALQARLAASGDLPPPPPGASDRNVGSGDAMFDATLEEAVRAFQRRHGLDVDGVVGSATLGALNVPLSERVRQIEANLERWRWLPQDLGRTHLLVNIADQRLQVVEQGETVLDMAVIVGRTYRRTPVFTGRMTYLVFNPTWEVPPALAVQDKLPELQADPVRMVQLGFQVLSGWGAEERVVDILEVDWSQVTRDRFPYRLRQLPGPQNALGRVKFMFPNKFNVYLHDTPARELFGRSQRTFSSGCIRVERPEALGVLLLSGQPPWTRETVLEAMDSGREQTVKLDVARPVHLLYWTAWTEPDGTVQFRSDIYGRDRLLEAALAEPPPTSP